MKSELFTSTRTPASVPDFVRYWAATYDYREEHLYDNNIRGPHTLDTLRQLFTWKIQKRFRDRQLPIAEKHFISRLADANVMCVRATAKQFLKEFPNGGAIHRIFWAHCWQPDRFPIYDQHVHRAMTFLLNGQREELKDYADVDKINSYLTRYIPFHQGFTGMDPRQLDRALWAFGKFIKKPAIPID